jgi:hypothetical protein
MLPEYLGTVPQIVTASSAITGLGIYLRFVIQNRRLYGDRLAELEKENRQLRADFDLYRKQCLEESDAQRELINGLRAQLGQMQMRELEAMQGRIPAATKARFKEG